MSTACSETEPTLLEQIEAKRKQLQEEIELLNDIGERVDWALDFCSYSSIDEHLTPLTYAIAEAHEELEEELEKINEEIENYKTEQAFALNDVDKSSNLKYYLE